MNRSQRIATAVALAIGGATMFGLWASAAELEVGAPAPAVRALDQDGRQVDFSEVYAQGWTLVYFYPKADTPGCTKQACSLRDAYTRLTARGVLVLGVSTDSPEEQKAWRSLLNPERFYDPKTNRVINLAENYLGVAARIASIGYQLGISDDRAFLDRLLDRAAVPFDNGNIYADDAPPTGRFDRYSNEYARYVYEAAETAGRKDLLNKLSASLKAQMRLWWDLVSEDGYGYNWGRSQGVVSYLDTPEIVGFLALHPEFRPAPLADIAALYYQAWNYLHNDYRNDAHLLSIFSFGRGNYAYISRDREWQQTTGFFGKVANSHTPIMNALQKEGVANFPVTPSLSPVLRFEFFRRTPERSAGVSGSPPRRTTSMVMSRRTSAGTWVVMFWSDMDE